MKYLVVILVLPLQAFGQLVVYTPSEVIDQTLPSSHYDTDYIYIDNISDDTVDLDFELIEENGPNGWYTSVCTSLICYSDVTDLGKIGKIAPGQQGYISFNLSANDIIGEGTYKFVITDKTHPEIRDTVAFIYHVEDEPEISNLPWVRINFNLNELTVILKNPIYETSLSIYDANGNRVVHRRVEGITSLKTNNLHRGIYLVVVKDETGRKMIEKIVNLR